VRVGHIEQETKKGCKHSKCEDFCQVLCVLWTTMHMNDWVLNKAEVLRKFFGICKGKKVNVFWTCHEK